MERLQVSGYQIFYEIVGSALQRSMQPLEIAYARSGTGDATLVCLHSLSAASSTFAELSARLDGEAEVIALDLRGFGGSNRPTQEYTVDVWVEDVVKLLEATGVSSPLVVYGHGLGACIALALARRRKLAGLALSGVALAAGAPSALTRLIASGEHEADVPALLRELTGSPVAEADLTGEIVARVARAWQAFEGRPLVGGLEAPVLVLGGEEDTLTPLDAEGGGAWVARASGGSLARLPGGHELPHAVPDDVAEALRNWLKDRR